MAGGLAAGLVLAAVVAGLAYVAARLTRPSTPPSLSAIMNDKCGKLFEAGQMREFRDCQDRVLDGHQIAYAHCTK